MFQFLLFPIILSAQANNEKQTSGLNTPGYKVIAFFSSECPICKKTASTLSQLTRSYSDSLSFILVFPGSFETKHKIKKFCALYNLKFGVDVLLDKELALTNKYGATVTPEFFLVNQEEHILYSGALDDRYVKIGIQKREPENYYLKDAIRAVLSGAEVIVKKTQPIGCLITPQNQGSVK